ncbi:hypothetical protein HPB47_025041, partial [Ixodes persulcatus]
MKVLFKCMNATLKVDTLVVQSEDNWAKKADEALSVCLHRHLVFAGLRVLCATDM